MKENTTKQFMRVFFVIAFISLIGVLWQWQEKYTSQVKVVGGSFTEGLVGTPRFINPVLAQSPTDKDMTELIFGSLLSTNNSGKTKLKLAESLDVSKDKKTYTLKLKNNIFFHDGVRITTDDIIFTIEKIQDPLIKSPLFTKWEGVEVKKVSNLEVTFTLPQEYSDFEDNLKIGILPKHLWNKIKSEEFIFNPLNNKPIGSGPYKIKKITYKKNGLPESYILTRSEQSHAYIKTITLFFYENEIELANAYREGKINAAYGLSANQENRDLFDNKFESTGKLPRVFGLFFNPKKQSLLKNRDIRLLINNIINKQKQDIINKVFAGYAYPINDALGDVQKDKKEVSIETYLKKLKESGWVKGEDGIYHKGKTGETLSLSISTLNVEELISIAKLIKKNLLNYGINIDIHIFEEGDFHQKVIRPRNYEILLFGYMIEKPTDLYAFWHSSQKSDPGLNISLYENKKVDKELEKLRKDKASANLNIIKEEIAKDIPAVFIYSPAYTYLLPKKIKGEEISINERQDRFAQIQDWYINTRKVLNMFIKK